MNLSRTIAILILLCATSAHADVTQVEAQMRRGVAQDRLNAAATTLLWAESLQDACVEMNARLAQVPLMLNLSQINSVVLALTQAELTAAGNEITIGRSLVTVGDGRMEAEQWEAAFDKFTAAANRGTAAQTILDRTVATLIHLWELLMGLVGPPVGGGIGPGGIF